MHVVILSKTCTLALQNIATYTQQMQRSGLHLHHHRPLPHCPQKEGPRLALVLFVHHLQVLQSQVAGHSAVL